MSQWGYVAAAYAATFAGAGGVTLWAWLAMRAAERSAADLRREP